MRKEDRYKLVDGKFVKIESRQKAEPKKPVPEAIHSIEEIETIGKRYETPRAKFLFYWLYLTGQRLNEALQTRRSDVSFQYDDGIEYMIIDSVTFKNKKNKRRQISFPTSGKEKWMIDYVRTILNRMTSDMGVFFNLQERNARKLLEKVMIDVWAVDPKDNERKQILLPLHPHYLRHCRSDHLTNIYGFTIPQLMTFFGWSSPTMPNTYNQSSWRQTARAFRTT